MKIAVLTRSEHWLTFLDGSGTEYYITIAHVSVKAKSYIILASTCTWVCRQGQSCRGFGTFYVIENKFCKASYEWYFVLSVFCEYKTNLADIFFF